MFSRFGGACLVAASLLFTQGCPKNQVPDSKSRLSGDRNPPPAVPVEIEAEVLPPDSGHNPAARSVILDYMKAENQRWMDRLQTVPEAPAYYLAYSVHEKHAIVLEAEGGVLTQDGDDTARVLDVDIRVGDPKLDNRRTLDDPQVNQLYNMQHLAPAPSGTDEKALRHHLWLETDRRYREAALILRLVQTQNQVSARSDVPPDFSHEEPVQLIQRERSLEFDREYWEKRVRDCSNKALRGVATRGTCQVALERNTLYFVNSEGSEIQRSWTTARFVVSVGVKADDGMQLGRLEQDFAETADGLPSESEIEKRINLVTKDLEDLHAAPVATPYAGPAILEGRASAVFFHEVFGHRIEGHRQKDKNFGKTFTDKIGEEIMPSWLSVYDDPTLRTLNGIYLNGYYPYDDEAVKARRVELVRNGVLKGFVIGRSPIEGLPSSNGHGRAEPGLAPVSRQGNLVVQSSRSTDLEGLYEALIAEVKRQKKPYGIVITDISGGFTQTSTFGSQHFEVQPIMAYRLYPDGKKELVRGIELSGQPLTALGSILSAARPLETFNGMCGAESGWVPVSASAPSLLLESLEVERAFEPSDRSPVLPPPAIHRGGAR